ncbi:MAG: PocR ligand-binding domain-containing protein [Kiritimatiellae bacterium]|nr:PocR ligand-binding domain-containing protein [Kiritimatiellia bacterium]MDD5522902.1 PocR ligand-binding domain-containing protein [Kiritimatiellia bacterium]
MNTVLSTTVDFRHLTESREFAEFSSLLKKLTGLVMALNSPGVGVIFHMFKSGEQNQICLLIRKDKEGLRRCSECDRKHHSYAVRSGKTHLYTCHAGFLDIAVPIFVFGRHVATISSGQILPEPHSDSGFKYMRKRLKWWDIPTSKLRSAYDSAPYLPRKQIKYVMQLLELFARQLCESAQKIRDLEAQMERVEIRRAREFVEQQIGNPSLHLRDAAKYAGLSHAHFSKVFHQVTGVNFTRYVQAQRITEAKRLLKETERTITDICFACGFNSLTHFNRVFRCFEHRSPRHYRQS